MAVRVITRSMKVAEFRDLLDAWDMECEIMGDYELSLVIPVNFENEEE